MLGVLLLVVVRPPAALRKHVVVAAALGNAGNLPLVLVAALIRETGGKLFGGEVSQLLLQLCRSSRSVTMWPAPSSSNSTALRLASSLGLQSQLSLGLQARGGGNEQAAAACGWVCMDPA